MGDCHVKSDETLHALKDVDEKYIGVLKAVTYIGPSSHQRSIFVHFCIV
jgi:hypothetical protein